MSVEEEEPCSPYKVLGLPDGVSLGVVREAYKAALFERPHEASAIEKAFTTIFQDAEGRCPSPPPERVEKNLTEDECTEIVRRTQGDTFDITPVNKESYFNTMNTSYYARQETFAFFGLRRK